MMKNLTIGKLAKEAGVNTDTVRYYERRNLVPEPNRTPSGYRIYLPETITRIKFIKQAQALGFTLNEIDELLKLRAKEDNAEEVKAQAQQKVVDIQDKIQMLEQMQNTLIELIEQCEKREPSAACPILKAIEPANETLEV